VITRFAKRGRLSQQRRGSPFRLRLLQPPRPGISIRIDSYDAQRNLRWSLGNRTPEEFVRGLQTTPTLHLSAEELRAIGHAPHPFWRPKHVATRARSAPSRFMVTASPSATVGDRGTVSTVAASFS
jgi:hypothetical protein